VVTGALLTGSLLAAQGNDQARSKKVRASKATATTTVKPGNRVVRTTTTPRQTRFVTRSSGNRVVSTTPTRTRYVTTTGGNRVVETTNTPVRTRVVTRSSSYPYSSTPYGYSSYGYGYPSYGYSGYSYGPSVSFGLGSPYYGSYYPYNYGYGYGYPGYGYNYPYNYNYGSYTYNNYGYGHGGSVVITVQSRLARMGYYHGPIDGIMGPETSFAIRAYERDHGLRMDGSINGPLMRSMGIRY
jgi:Putative peptidoglycan binding domain